MIDQLHTVPLATIAVSLGDLSDAAVVTLAARLSRALWPERQLSSLDLRVSARSLRSSVYPINDG